MAQDPIRADVATADDEAEVQGRIEAGDTAEIHDGRDHDMPRSTWAWALAANA